VSDTLVVGPLDTTSPVAGTHLVESLVDLSTSIRSESWLDATLNGAAAVMDAAAAVMDPIGSLISAGLGWLMEHLEPLKGWLDDLTGDAGAVLGFAATWDNIAAELDLAAGDYTRVLRHDVGAMTGHGVQAYLAHADGVTGNLRGLTSASSAVAAALRTASTVVQTVRELVRDALADLVGAAISWGLQVAVTAGLGTPWVAAQVATRVSSLVARVGGKVTAVVRSMTSLRGLVSELDGVLAGLARLLVRPRGGGARSRAAVGSGRPSVLALPTRTPAQMGDATRPSRPPDPDARPRGRPARIEPKSDAATVRGRTRENEAAALLARLGYDVEQSPAVPGAKNPDYLIEGRVFDAYAPQADRPRNIWSEVQKKVLKGQADRILIVLEDSSVTMGALTRQFGEYAIPGLNEVLALRDGTVVPLPIRINR
jgi:hypothetical protein